MNSWASIAKKNNASSNVSNNIKLQKTIQTNALINYNNDMMLIKNKHSNSISEIYNGLLDKLNNGYFTILSIDTHQKRDQFITMILDNFNIDYHIKYDNFNSDSDIPEINISDDEEFVPTYSKFAYQ